MLLKKIKKRATFLRSKTYNRYFTTRADSDEKMLHYLKIKKC